MPPAVPASLSEPTDWDSASWWAAVGDWAGVALRLEGAELTSGFAVVSRTPWRIEAQAPSTRGSVRFVAARQPHFFEGPSLASAAGYAPDGFTAPLAHHRGRGWILLPLGETAPLSALLPAFLPAWADVQRALIPSRLPLQMQGLPVMDPAWLPTFLENQIRHHSDLPDDDALALSSPETARLSEQVLPLVRASCERLSAKGTPLALDPVTLAEGDLVAGGRQPRLCRLSDASLSHPFTVLPTAAQAWTAAGLPEEEFAAAAIAYLRVMRPEATRQELLSETLDAAIIAPLNRYSALLRQTGNPAALDELRSLGTLPPLLERLITAYADIPAGTTPPAAPAQPAAPAAAPAPPKPAPRRAARRAL